MSAAELDGETFLLLKGNGFWRELWDRHFPRSQFLVQEDRAVFEQLASSSLPYFVTDAPAHAAPAPDRTRGAHPRRHGPRDPPPAGPSRRPPEAANVFERVRAR